MQRPALLMMWWRKSNRGGPLHWWQLPACRHGHSRCPTRWRRPKPSDRSGQSSSDRRCRPVFFGATNKRIFFFNKKLLNYSNEQFFRKCNFQNQTKNSSPQQVVDEENFCRGKKLNSAGHLDIFQENFHIQCHNSMKFNCYTHIELGDGSFVTCAIIANLDSSKKG